VVFITVSRQTGSLGKEITDLLASQLNFPVITRNMVMNQWLPEIATKHELHMLAESPGFYLNSCADGITFAEHVENKLRSFISEQSAVIFGLGAQVIFAHHPDAIHVKIISSHDIRINRIMQTHHMEKYNAERFLELTDRKHKRFITTLYKKDWSDPSLYHITLNTDFLSLEESTSILYNFTKNKQTCPVQSNEPHEQNRRPVIFKHPSEEEFAKILDMHNLEWEYEPRTFPIKWDDEGNITLAFSPDFYLPGFNTFIELTTMNQKYVSEKKKKVELLKKLYPGTNINIVYKNDFYTLMERFGLKEGSAK